MRKKKAKFQSEKKVDKTLENLCGMISSLSQVVKEIEDNLGPSAWEAGYPKSGKGVVSPPDPR